MRLTNQLKEKRSEVIKKAIDSLLEKGEFSVAVLSKETGISSSTLYLQPEVLETIKPKKITQIDGVSINNANYLGIVQAGYQVGIKFTKKDANLLVLKEGKELFKTPFRPNGRTHDALMTYLPVAKKFTTVDQALQKALEFVRTKS
ncbi:hypothetical protein [Burkholderia contaminans]|uniref:hypothetical protein n=1 Tax=Burkholderia contaminans TaxID=488447 RepID=UPI00158DEE79|nr:hypothetical protein [Burkholderia contaminans]